MSMKNIRCLTGILIPATLFVGSLGICVYALIADPLYSGPVQHAKHITISSVNVTLTGHFGGGSIVFFNQDFPYQASITYGSQEGEGVRIKAFDWCGIQFYTLESTIH